MSVALSTASWSCLFFFFESLIGRAVFFLETAPGEAAPLPDGAEAARPFDADWEALGHNAKDAATRTTSPDSCASLRIDDVSVGRH
jgi:hypothetical protein